MRKQLYVVAAVFVGTGLTLGGQQTAPAAPPVAPGQGTAAPASATNLGSDANGNPLRRALKTGHVSNYDEAKVAPFTLPDPLLLANGRPVRDRQTWVKQRRPEILRMYETEIFGRTPAKAPAVTWQVAETDAHARDGAAVMKKIVGTIGSGPDAPQIKLTLYTPAAAKKPVPVILLVNFGGGPPPPPPAQGRGGAGFPTDPPVAAEIISRGWGYATVGYQDIQPDRLNTFTQGVIGRTLAPGQEQPAPGRVGNDQRVVVGRQPDDRLPRDRSIGECQTDRALRPLASGQDRALGDGEGRAHRRGVLELLGRDGRGARAA